MAVAILMPALSPTMTEGNLAKWCKNIGDEIKSGDIIAEVETDKATMEIEAIEEGFISKLIVEERDLIKFFFGFHPSNFLALFTSG